jgi:acyl-coenzyme A thioesterase PaaI-like protein
MKSSWLRRLVNFWPPFLFNSIGATYIAQDFREIHVALKLRFYNRNYVGVHFGGNLFAMTDPWYMLMLMQNLGRDYYVWDKKATIEFISPGRGTVTANFLLTAEKLEEIRAATANGEKYLPEFTVEIYDAQQHLVARVHKTVYVKLKPAKEK